MIALEFLDNPPGVYYVYRRGCSGQFDNVLARAASFDEACAKTDSYAWTIHVSDETIRQQAFNVELAKTIDDHTWDKADLRALAL